jgi:hypothetical protein
MSLRKSEIDATIDGIIESIIFEVFEGNFSSETEVELALTILKQKIEDLELDDFEHIIES